MMWLDSKWFLCKGYFEVTYKFKNGNFTFIITYISEYEFQSTIRVLNSWTRAIDNNVVEELDYFGPRHLTATQSFMLHRKQSSGNCQKNGYNQR